MSLRGLWQSHALQQEDHDSLHLPRTNVFGWAQNESIAFTQLGVHQYDLGIAGGLAGVARFAGGSVAQAIYNQRAITECMEAAQKLWPEMSPLPLHGTLLERGDHRRKDVVVGLCSGNTQEGDILARPLNKNDMLYALILRPGFQCVINGYQEDIYEIVGQAILVRGCESDPDGSLKVPGTVTNVPPHVAFSLTWGIEDAFLFYSREDDELKRAIVHSQDAGQTWTMFDKDSLFDKKGKNKAMPLPCVPADFVKSAIRLVTNVTSHRTSSFAIANAALGEDTDGASLDSGYPYSQEAGRDRFDIDIEKLARAYTL